MSMTEKEPFITTDMCKVILFEKMSLARIMRVTGAPEELIKTTVTNQMISPEGVQRASMIILQSAYKRLLKENVIDDSKVFNLDTRKFDDGNNRESTFGFLKDGVYCWKKDKWQFCY